MFEKLKKDYIGKRFGKLVIADLYRLSNSKKVFAWAVVKCDCGRDDIYDLNEIIDGRVGCLCVDELSNAPKLIKNYNEYVGKKFITNEGNEILIIDYKDRHNLTIKFTSDGFIRKGVTLANVIKGQCDSPYTRSIYGIGYLGVGNYVPRTNFVKCVQYIKWFSMFNRCYSDKVHEVNPKYSDCSVDESFHCFQDFAKWFDENYYEIDGEIMELDKDLLIKGNRIYSKDTCCFLPQRINRMLVKSDSMRNGIIGVHNKCGRYLSVLSSKETSNEKKISKMFTTEEDAFRWYKENKENNIKRVAEEYRDKIPKNVYDALINYKVEITD